jgi:hypothetical protein
MTRCPTPGHLASWAKFAPGVSESAGKKKGVNATSHGDPYLARVLGEAARRRGPHRFLSRRALRRLARRRGKRKAIVAVGCSILVIIWHLISDPSVRYADLGPGCHDNRNSNSHEMRGQIRQPEARLPSHPSNQPLHTTRPRCPWYCRAPSRDR